MRILLSIVVNAIALWVASELLPGISFGGEGGDLLITVLVVALVFGVLNALVRPVLQLLSLPLIVLSLGLFLFVINAVMLSLTSWLAGVLGQDFVVESFFWDAILGSLIISAVGVVLGMLLPDRERR
jgi:putative membrane protein